MTTMDTATHIILQATAAYQRRRCSWYPGDAPAPAVGRLRIVVQKGKSPGDSDSVCDYDVTPAPSLPGWRAFTLTKADTGERYVCRISSRMVTCSCKAGQTGLDTCKHLASLKALLVKGVL